MSRPIGLADYGAFAKRDLKRVVRPIDVEVVPPRSGCTQKDSALPTEWPWIRITGPKPTSRYLFP